MYTRRYRSIKTTIQEESWAKEAEWIQYVKDTNLARAADKDNLETAKELLDNGANPNAIHSYDVERECQAYDGSYNVYYTSQEYVGTVRYLPVNGCNYTFDGTKYEHAPSLPMVALLVSYGAVLGSPASNSKSLPEIDPARARIKNLMIGCMLDDTGADYIFSQPLPLQDFLFGGGLKLLNTYLLVSELSLITLDYLGLRDGRSIIAIMDKFSLFQHKESLLKKVEEYNQQWVPFPSHGKRAKSLLTVFADAKTEVELKDELKRQKDEFDKPITTKSKNDPKIAGHKQPLHNSKRDKLYDILVSHLSEFSVTQDLREEKNEEKQALVLSFRPAGQPLQPKDSSTPSYSAAFNLIQAQSTKVDQQMEFQNLVNKTATFTEISQIFDEIKQNITELKVNKHRNPRRDWLFGIHHTRGWRETTEHARSAALKKLKSEVSGLNTVDEQIALYQRAKKLSIFKDHRNNSIFVGAFGRTAAVKEIDKQIAILKTKPK